MPAERPAVPVEVLRRAVRERVAESSVRVVAEQTGMSPTGLWRFIQGTAPYAKTRRRLQSWYVVQQAAAPVSDEVMPEAAHAALDLLTRHVADRRREARQRALLDILVEPGDREPPWLGTLRGTTPPG